MEVLAAIVLALFAFVLGLGFLFFGYRVFLVLLPIWGFFAGLWIGAQATHLLLGTDFLGTVTGWVVGVIAGFLLAIFSYFFYFLGVAIIGGAVGFALATGLLAALGIESSIILFIAGLVVGIIAAVLTIGLNIQKYVVIALTALGGANGVILSFLLLFGRVTTADLSASGNPIIPIYQDSPIWLLAWLVLAVLGFIYQIRINRTYEFTREMYIEGFG